MKILILRKIYNPVPKKLQDGSRMQKLKEQKEIPENSNHVSETGHEC